MAHRISADRIAIQNEIAPFILYSILSQLKKGSKDSILDLLEYLDDLNITNEMIKEHLRGLNMDKKIIDQFEKIPSATKSNFTRNYNK